jgi:hypothetical protein
MFIFYPPKEPRSEPMSFEGYERWNANKHWATHFYNKVALTHIAKATRDLNEKQTALAEIGIAEDKQKWWERHPNFSLEGAKIVLKRDYGIDA